MALTILWHTSCSHRKVLNVWNTVPDFWMAKATKPFSVQQDKSCWLFSVGSLHHCRDKLFLQNVLVQVSSCKTEQRGMNFISVWSFKSFDSEWYVTGTVVSMYVVCARLHLWTPAGWSAGSPPKAGASHSAHTVRGPPAALLGGLYLQRTLCPDNTQVTSHKWHINQCWMEHLERIQMDDKVAFTDYCHRWGGYCPSLYLQTDDGHGLPCFVFEHLFPQQVLKQWKMSVYFTKKTLRVWHKLDGLSEAEWVYLDEDIQGVLTEISSHFKCHS